MAEDKACKAGAFKMTLQHAKTLAGAGKERKKIKPRKVKGDPENYKMRY